LLYVGRKARIERTGALSDIAPTLLRIMGLPQPPEMTGNPLIDFG
jgi:2,3-bisphosphoglycerate-independent phosphoglycerate mutase